MNVLFMGTPDYAEAILKGLIEDQSINVVGVFTQPDKPVGRKAVLTPPPVKVLAQLHNIPVYQPERLRNSESVETVLSIACDLIIVAAYGQILPKEILDYVPCINLHASILPQYRGASPIQQSILNNDNESGVTAMWMDEGLDTGAIIKISRLEIGNDEMVSSLYKRLTTLAIELTLDVVHHWDRKTVLPQNDSLASHCKKIAKNDGLVAFEDAEEIYNRYRAFTPWPGIFLDSGLKLKEMKLDNKEKTGKAGEIIFIDSDGIGIQCAKGVLKVLKVQAPSKQEMLATDYINGKRLGCGNILA